MKDDIYELRIALKDTKPPIWRRVAVPGGLTLGQLHYVIQIAMGWTNSHLHQFIYKDKALLRRGAVIDQLDREERWLDLRVALRGERVFVERAPEFKDFGMEGEDEESVTLGEIIVEPKKKLLYEYDFGDGWQHDIIVQKIYEPKEGVDYPVCLAGKGACPPEDCGGVWGYYHLLDVLADPKHEDHEAMLEWMGGPIDPDAFDMDEVNEVLDEFAREVLGRGKKKGRNR